MSVLQIEEVKEIQNLIKNCVTKEVIIIQFELDKTIKIASSDLEFMTHYSTKKKAKILSLFENRGLFAMLFINENEIIYKKTSLE